jgi:hypothetical protein
MTTEQQRFVDARLAVLRADEEGGASFITRHELASARAALKFKVERDEAVERSEHIYAAEWALIARWRKH